MKNLLVAVLICMSFTTWSQQTGVEAINNYKYVIVPSKFSFLKKDEYQLNTFFKMYFEKYGFKAFFDTDLLPPEAAGDNCNKLFADLESQSTMFNTKTTVVLKD